MNRPLSAITLFIAIASLSFAQVGGGSAAFGQRQSGNDSAQANERAKRSISKDDMPPNATSIFLDASVLINVKADEYVAVFGVSEEGPTLDEARKKTDAAIAAFTAELRSTGVGANDLFIDFVAQNRIFGFEVVGDVAKEKVVGFDVKKNVSVHYRDKDQLERYLEVASKSGIFDLIKVDYVVKDQAAVQERLMAEAAKVIKRKAAAHERLFGAKLRPSGQLYAERYGSYFPTEMYSNYTAQEAEQVYGYRPNMTVHRARKAQTFYFDALDAKGFDQVVNPVVIEPVVQFTLYLKIRYETAVASPKAAPAKKVAPRK